MNGHFEPWLPGPAGRPNAPLLQTWWVPFESSRSIALIYLPAHGTKSDAQAEADTTSTVTMPETGMTSRYEESMSQRSSAPDCNGEANSNLPVEVKVGGYDGAADAEIDPNSDRRKRRKVTPLPQEGKHTWRQQLDDAANSIDFGNSPDATCQPSSSRQTEQSAAASPRRSSRISIAKRADVDDAADSYPDQDPIPERPQAVGTDVNQDEQKTTPKKKMLKLTGKGKLIKSPTLTPKATKVKKTSSKGVGQISLQHGRIAPSLKVVIPYRHDGRRWVQTAEKIDRIIEGTLRISTNDTVLVKGQARVNKPTHPFFVGKKLQQDPEKSAPAGEDQAANGASTESTVVSAKQPVPWSEIKFCSKMSRPKDPGTQSSLWPPLSLQHVQPSRFDYHAVQRFPQSAHAAKRKQDAVQVPEDEDILRSYASALLGTCVATRDVQLPERLCLDEKQMMELLGAESWSGKTSEDSNMVLQKMHCRALTSRSAFDQGRAAGPQDWVHSYSPKRADETLQPQAVVLRDWLAKHKIHQVQSKIAERRERRHIKRPGRKRKAKRDDELDGFIASSDDEAMDDKKSVKNLIILCGPSGTGKTASVYAVAQELDFEVFEIHPGMRRSAKDIFDKVGDMAHNHLVQPSAALSRDSSILTEGPDQVSTGEDIATGKQSTIGNFLGGRKKATDRPDTPQPERPSLQKQSVILFEEVDILFEEDKSFWSGVQALIQQTKRPIVLTCNSLESIPTEELSIHATLHFERVPLPDAVEYLVNVAAGEGHLLSRKDLETLYLGRGRDLRSCLTELNFWCQMTVGSKLGGLDWMRQPSSSQSMGSRIISKGTYHSGLNLVPGCDLSQEDLMSFAQETIDLSTLDWEESQYSHLAEFAEHCDRLDGVHDCLRLAEAKSGMDVLDDAIRPLISTVATAAFPHLRRQIHPEGLIGGLLTTPNVPKLSCTDMVDIFEPLMEDFRTFPPTTGRGAASLDGASQTVVTEIGPYVRSIVAFDQRLEAMRDALSGGSQSIGQRKTRAARAALEGGDKANTRRERWFPKDLDFEKVLQTMPGWFYEHEAGLTVLNIESLPSSQATTSEDGITVATPNESDAVMDVGKGTTID